MITFTSWPLSIYKAANVVINALSGQKFEKIKLIHSFFLNCIEPSHIELNELEASVKWITSLLTRKLTKNNNNKKKK